MRSLKAGLICISMSMLLFAAVAAQTKTAPPSATPDPAKAAPATPPTTAKPATPATPPAAAKPASAKAEAAPKAEATGPRSIVGEVVDPACWIINGASGKGHAECAAACARAGQTLAILEKRTNKLYILAGGHPGEDPNKGVMDYIGQPVVVKGRVFSRHGALGIQVASIEPYTAKPMP